MPGGASSDFGGASRNAIGRPLNPATMEAPDRDAEILEKRGRLCAAIAASAAWPSAARQRAWPARAWASSYGFPRRAIGRRLPGKGAGGGVVVVGFGELGAAAGCVTEQPRRAVNDMVDERARVLCRVAGDEDPAYLCQRCVAVDVAGVMPSVRRRACSVLPWSSSSNAAAPVSQASSPSESERVLGYAAGRGPRAVEVISEAEDARFGEQYVSPGGMCVRPRDHLFDSVEKLVPLPGFFHPVDDVAACVHLIGGVSGADAVGDRVVEHGRRIGGPVENEQAFSEMGRRHPDIA